MGALAYRVTLAYTSFSTGLIATLVLAALLGVMIRTRHGSVAPERESVRPTATAA
jgi:hypothetical protein